MPKRRTEDVVHAVMTDHYIQRRKPARDLLEPLQESDFEAEGNYRGEVLCITLQTSRKHRKTNCTWMSRRSTMARI